MASGGLQGHRACIAYPKVDPLEDCIPLTKPTLEKMMGKIGSATAKGLKAGIYRERERRCLVGHAILTADSYSLT
eukprot:7367172-Pyramimonas_sp.AAC.1